MKKNAEFVGVDEKYIPEDEKYVDESVIGNQEEAKEFLKNAGKKGVKVAKGVAIGYICFIVVVLVLMISLPIIIINQANKMKEEYNQSVEQMQEEHNQSVEQMQEEQNQRFEQMKKDIIN